MGCISFAKGIIVSVNALIVIACAIVMGVCYQKMSTEDGKEYYDLFKKSTGFMIFIMVIAFCFVVCVIGFLLICCKNKCWRVLYCLGMTVVVIAEVACAAVIYTYTDKALDYVGEQWEKADTNKAVNTSVRSAEITFKCCGFKNATEKDLARCQEYSEDEYEPANMATTCYESLKTTIKDNLNYFGIGTIVILVVEVLLYIFSIYYACLAKEKIEGEEDTDITKDP